MKYLLTLMVFISISFGLNAQQNLVPNPSFEDTISCPTYYNEINRTFFWQAFKETPDYFNSCNSNFVGVPNNDVGFQYARTGNAYAGFLSFARTAFNGREAFGIQLNNSLIIGEKYIVSFFVSVAVRRGQSYCGIASNKLGARFSTVPYSYANPTPINNFAHIYSDSIITDTTNWVEIAGIFIADSAYQYLCIGNFFQDSLTSHFVIDSLAAFAYYYVDDVSVLLDSESVSSDNNLDYNRFPAIFPNPANNYIIVSGSKLKSYNIFNVIGKVVLYDDFINSAKNEINLTFVEPGVYYILIKSDAGDTIHKIIITN